MKVIKRFEENLEYLGFDLAPVAWDLARFPFESDADRIILLMVLLLTAAVGLHPTSLNLLIPQRLMYSYSNKETLLPTHV